MRISPPPPPPPLDSQLLNSQLTFYVRGDQSRRAQNAIIEFAISLKTQSFYYAFKCGPTVPHLDTHIYRQTDAQTDIHSYIHTVAIIPRLRDVPKAPVPIGHTPYPQAITGCPISRHEGWRCDVQAHDWSLCGDVIETDSSTLFSNKQL